MKCALAHTDTRIGYAPMKSDSMSERGWNESDTDKTVAIIILVVVRGWCGCGLIGSGSTHSAHNTEHTLHTSL